jgi:hypothetical protein
MSNPVEAAPSPVDTAKVTSRRDLHFDSIDQVLAEVDRLVEAERAGKLKHVGNWTLGQTLGHLACWTEYGYTDFPLKPPFFIRWFLRLRKNSWLHKPMQPGLRIPGVAGGTMATEPMPLDEALPRFRKVMERLKTEEPPVPSPALGKLTHQESIAITLRHAELHLGFMVPT